MCFNLQKRFIIAVFLKKKKRKKEPTAKET